MDRVFAKCIFVGRVPSAGLRPLIHDVCGDSPNCRQVKQFGPPHQNRGHKAGLISQTHENRTMPHRSHMRPPRHNITRIKCREASSFLLRFAARKTPGVIVCTLGLQPARPQASSFVSLACSPQSPQGVIVRSEGLRPARPPGVMRVCGPALQPSRHPCVNICISGLQPASPPGVIIRIAGLQPVRPPGVIMCL